MALSASEKQPYFPYEPSEDDFAWANSNERWLAETKAGGARRARHERTSEPLILCGHGVSLRVDKGTLLVRNGFTHYPQAREEFRFFKGDLNLPPRIIMLDGSGSLSFDVLSWLSEQDVPLIRADYQGDVVTVMAGAGSALDRDRINWQDDTRNDDQKRLAFCCDLITDKISATVGTMQAALPPSKARDLALSRADAAMKRLRARRVRCVNDIMMVEAAAAAAYFTAWQGLPLRWKSRSKHPVPEAWLAAGSRRAVRDSRFATNRNATHPVNAMLNYGYALLHSQVQIGAVAAGYDPKRGILHESRPDASALVLDLMEPRRPIVDAAILKFVAANTFSGADFVIRADGACRLTPQLTRIVCKLTTDAVTEVEVARRL